MANKLALFDFDGTLTNRDSLLDFILFSNSIPRVIFGFLILSPVLLAYKLGLYNNSKAKQKVIAFYFKGWEVERFSRAGALYSRDRLPKILKGVAIKKLKWHLGQGHKVVVVTASIEDWIIHWADENGIDLIATRLKKSDGIVTGSFDSKNCYGEQKVLRIREKYNLKQYDNIYAYGDSKGDLPMLEIADFPFYRKYD